MKKSFTFGAVSGISALAIGFPLAAQFAGAQSSEISQTSVTPTDRPGFHGERAPFTQEDVQDMIDRDNAILLNIDAAVAIHKAAIQNHRIALTAAADIADETERNDAVKAAHEALRAEIQAAIEANPDLKGAMMPFGPHGKGGHHGHRGPGPEQLAEKLGMTPEALKAEIDSGKTIEEIAEEQGIELPARPAFRGPFPKDAMDEDDEVQD